MLASWGGVESFRFPLGDLLALTPFLVSFKNQCGLFCWDGDEADNNGSH